MTAQMVPVCYVVAETTIESDIELFELERAPETAPDGLRVHRGEALPDELRETIAQWSLNSLGFGSGLDHQQRLVVTWAGVGTIVIGSGGADMIVYPDPDGTARRVSHLVVDHALPRLFWQRGRTVFHATSVAIGGKGVGFVAPAGTGKSTLAASFALAGNPLLSDDCLVLDRAESGFEIVPSYCGSRLLPDSARGLAIDETLLGEGTGRKLAVRFDHAAVRRYPLAALVSVERAEGPIALDLVAPADAFWLLGRRAFVTGDNQRAFVALADVADVVPVWSLRYPSSFAALDEVRERVLTILERG
jgi:hypothetical protein